VYIVWHGMSAGGSASREVEETKLQQTLDGPCP
jgi:hypothetical protein